MEVDIRDAREGDAEDIINLLNEVFSAQQRSKGLRDLNYFKWKFNSSPFGDSILTICLHNNKIVGFDHLWPWHLEYNGVSLLAYSACDSIVKREFRGRRLLQQMRTYGIEQARKKGADLMFNFPNSQSLKTNLNFGYKFIGKLKWWIKVVNPIDTAKIFIGIEAKDSIAEQKESSNLLSATPLDSDFLSSIWQDNKPKTLITIDKNREYFEYRYITHQSREYKMISYNSKIVAIYTINLNRGFREMVVTEIIGDKNYIGELLSIINKEAKLLKCAFIAIVSDNFLLDNSLFFKGYISKRDKNMVVYKLNGTLENYIFESSSWNLSASLHDSI